MVPPAQPFEFSLAPWPSSSFGAAGKLTCPDLTGSARRQICKSTMRLLRPWWTAVCKQSRACLRHQWVLVIREHMSGCGSQRLQTEDDPAIDRTCSKFSHHHRSGRDLSPHGGVFSLLFTVSKSSPQSHVRRETDRQHNTHHAGKRFGFQQNRRYRKDRFWIAVDRRPHLLGAHIGANISLVFSSAHQCLKFLLRGYHQIRNAASEDETGIVRARPASSRDELMTKHWLSKLLTTSLVRKERRMFEMLLAPPARPTSNIICHLRFHWSCEFR